MAILLISDLHLQEKRPDLTRAFLSFLEQHARQAQALYILGDFFEYWIGDDGMSAYQQQIAAALKALSEQGTPVFIMHGNRDFLIGKGFCRAAGCRLLADPWRTTLAGLPVLLMHGDSLCTRDIGYQKLRRWLRNPFSLWLLRHLPLAWRQRLAGRLRDESRQQTRYKAADIVDVTDQEVERLMRQQGVLTLIHGHTHRPALHRFLLDGKPACRMVLGDWDRHGWFALIDDQGLRQYRFDLDSGEPTVVLPE